MAKNKSRKHKPADQAGSQKEEVLKEQTETAAAVEAAEKSDTAGSQEANKPDSSASKGSSKKKELMYQVVTKRDPGVIKAYITFTYRVFHPGVSARLFIYGLLLVLPGLFFFKDIFWKAFFIGIGAALILLAFFRQYISLWMTERSDADYKAGTVFTYNFYEVGAEFLKGDTRFLRLDRYKDISNFYYDDEYYYLTIQGRDLFVIPKSAFTVGDAAEFEEFIYRKSRHTCRWIPNKLSDKLKKRRAERAVATDNMMKK